MHNAIAPDTGIDAGAQLSALVLAILCGGGKRHLEYIQYRQIYLLALTCYAQRGPGYQFHPVEGVFAIAGTQKLHADGA